MLTGESGQIARRLVVFGVVFAFIILVLAEVGPLIWQRFSVAQDADDFANAAANQYNAYHDEGGAFVVVGVVLVRGGVREIIGVLSDREPLPDERPDLSEDQDDEGEDDPEDHQAPGDLAALTGQHSM